MENQTFVLVTKQVLQAVNHAVKILPSKSIKDILKCIYFSFKKTENESNFIMRTTNMESYIEVSVPVVQTDGDSIDFATYGDLFHEILKNIHTDTFKLIVSYEKVDETIMVRKITVSTEKSSAMLPSLPQENFPAFPTIPEKNTLVVSNGKLKKAINDTFYAVSKDKNISGNPVTCLFMEFEQGNKISFVGTTGIVLSKSSFVNDKEVPDCFAQSKILLPPAAVQEILFFLSLSKNDFVINFDVNERFISIDYDNVRSLSRLYSGEYPNYRKIADNREGFSLSFDKSSLLNDLKFISVITENDDCIVCCFDKEAMTIKASNNTKGSGSISSPYIHEVTDEIIPDKFEIRFNPSLLTESINKYEGDGIVLKLSNERSPVFITSDNEEDHFAIVMPMSS